VSKAFGENLARLYADKAAMDICLFAVVSF
jgi:hypothetical protein